MTRVRRLIAAAILIVLAVSPVAAAKAPKSRTPKGATTAPADTTTVLVRVGGEPITRAMVQQRLEEIPEGMRATYSTPDGRQQLLERMVEERVWLITATRAGVQDRPKVKQTLEQQRRDLLIRTWLTEAMASVPAPSDSDAHVYYDQHQNDYQVPATVTVRHIQTRTEAEARRLLALARVKGTDFAALAKKWTTDSLTRNSGGLLGSVTHDGVFGPIGAQKALAESAFALPEGGVGGPYKTERGWHVLHIDQKKDESLRPFEQVRPMITRQLSGQRSQEYYRTLLDKARQDLGVEADSNAIHGFTSMKKDARELFQEAQAAGPADDRIALYQRLLDEFPDSDVAPQAQFMVGFIRSEELKRYDEAGEAFHRLLQRYPKFELAASAKWMLEHMRSEDVPPMLQLGADSTGSAAPVDSVSHKARGASRKS
jgi:tetratricopeptide (TPR) repeat protein